MLSDESVLSLAPSVGILEQTLRRLKSQAQVDVGLAEGAISMGSQALRDAYQRIEKLKEELALIGASSEIVDAQVVVTPKVNSRRGRT